MLIHFCKYFFTYIFKAKTRQKLLFLAIGGLIISSFSLLVLQSTMGGLQNNLITRSKNVLGHGVVYLKNHSEKKAMALAKKFSKDGEDLFLEYEIELLLRNENYLTPVIVHALFGLKNPRPKFLSHLKLGELILPFDLSHKLRVMPGDQVQLISPAHVDPLLGDVPRQTSLIIDDMVETSVPEVDSAHMWTNLKVIQNLVRERSVNRIRIFKSLDFENLKKIFESKDAHIQTWEEENKNLVWALGLESTVMVFLFICMTLLVSLCISSGLLVFFGKIKNDLASFWILGATEGNVKKSAGVFLVFISLVSVLIGLGLGFIFLWAFDKVGPDIMPNIFVERKIPIYITSKGVFISFFVPFGISILFSYFSLNQVGSREGEYLEQIRTIG